MADPVDRHYRMVDEQESIGRMKKALRCLNEANVAYVVEGGWAVAAYGSKVPSIDLDVLVPGGLDQEVAKAIEDATGYQMYSQSTQDLLALEIVDMNHANPLIDRPALSYVPSELLQGSTEPRLIDIAGGIEVPVPSPHCLAFMKLKAFHDRLLQWRAASGERYLLAGMPENERENTIRRGSDHWLRKAGKDLFDVSFLCHKHTSLEKTMQTGPVKMWSKCSESLQNIPIPIISFAEGMKERADCVNVSLLGSRPHRKG